MQNNSTQIKTTLLSLIESMSNHVGDFVRNPGKDFTRNRSLDFQTTIRFILSLGANTLSDELIRFFSLENIPTASAFVQQRDKILPETFLSLLKAFNHSIQPEVKLFHGYRLLAIDGTGLSLPYNHKEQEYIRKNEHCNSMHLNTIYDLCSRFFLDASISPGNKTEEVSSAVSFVQHTSERFPAIFIADRGYENYNLFAHIEERLFDYVIRIKDISGKSIISAIDYPNTPEFDITRNLVITRHSTGPAVVNPKVYKYFTKAARFDFIPDSAASDYDITIRFVRFQLPDGSFTVLATSLSEELFPVSLLKEIYHMRWGIETAYREAKKVLGLEVFHSKKAASVSQEVYARLIMYNFCMFICSSLSPQQNNRKHPIQINYTQAIKICLHFFRLPVTISPPDIEALILRYLLPVRCDRSFPRKALSKSVVSFNYRLS